MNNEEKEIIQAVLEINLDQIKNMLYDFMIPNY